MHQAFQIINGEIWPISYFKLTTDYWVDLSGKYNKKRSKVFKTLVEAQGELDMKNFEATLKNCTDLAIKNSLMIVYLDKWLVYEGLTIDDCDLLTFASDIFELETELYKIDENLNR